MTSEKLSTFTNSWKPGGFNNPGREQKSPKCTQHETKILRVNKLPADLCPHGSEAEMELNSAVPELNEHILSAQYLSG